MRDVYVKQYIAKTSYAFCFSLIKNLINYHPQIYLSEETLKYAPILKVWPVPKHTYMYCNTPLNSIENVRKKSFENPLFRSVFI